MMAYLSSGSMVEPGTLASLRVLLLAYGWTPVTAPCTILFSLIHWPCSTTCLTIWKETQSLKWTAAAILLPTALGVILCVAVASVRRMLG